MDILELKNIISDIKTYWMGLVLEMTIKESMS